MKDFKNKYAKISDVQLKSIVGGNGILDWSARLTGRVAGVIVGTVMNYKPWYKGPRH